LRFEVAHFSHFVAVEMGDRTTCTSDKTKISLTGYESYFHLEYFDRTLSGGRDLDRVRVIANDSAGGKRVGQQSISIRHRFLATHSAPDAVNGYVCRITSHASGRDLDNRLGRPAGCRVRAQR
jgi:hypothetical protein